MYREASAHAAKLTKTRKSRKLDQESVAKLPLHHGSTTGFFPRVRRAVPGGELNSAVCSKDFVVFVVSCVSWPALASVLISEDAAHAHAQSCRRRPRCRSVDPDGNAQAPVAPRRRAAGAPDGTAGLRGGALRRARRRRVRT